MLGRLVQTDFLFAKIRASEWMWLRSDYKGAAEIKYTAESHQGRYLLYYVSPPERRQYYHVLLNPCAFRVFLKS